LKEAKQGKHDSVVVGKRDLSGGINKLLTSSVSKNILRKVKDVSVGIVNREKEKYLFQIGKDSR
jgi:hypothetical protein